MKTYLTLLVLTCSAVLAGCGGGSAPSVNQSPVLQSVQITPNAPSIAAGLGQKLTATAKYSDGHTVDVTSSATWTSSNSGTATVSSSGQITTKAAGTATITATYSSVSGSVTLTVTAPVIASLVVSAPSLSIAAGTTVQFSASGTFTDGSVQDATGQVTWTSSATSVAKINVNGAAGLAMGVAAGSATITATVGSASSSATLTVTNATLNSISVTPASPAIPLGQVQQFTATGTFSDGTTQNITGTVTWTSSSPTTVSITTSGLASGKNLGSATITATSGAVQASATATVNAADLASLAINPANQTIAPNTSQAFSAIGTFTDGSTRNLTSQVTWTSDTPTVAKIGSGTGIAKAVSSGSANISATLGTNVATTSLTVNTATVTSISVAPAGESLAPGTQLAYTATGTFSDGSTQNITRDVTWASDNTSVAKIAVAGVATAVAPGTATISASLGGITGSTSLTVNAVTLQSIAVSPATAVLAPTATQQYTAVGTYSDGSTQTITATVTWSSSATTVATISAFGQATGQSAGQATITAAQGSVSGNAAVVVESSPLTSLQISPASATVAVQTGTQFRAIGTFADGSTEDLTGSASWTSSPASVATVSAAPSTKGLATGISPGSATITALFAGEVGVASLTVTNASLTSISISPANPSIAVGTSQQFTATGTFTDGTTENLTTQVTWTSSNVNVATVGPGGLATTSATGSTTVTASLNGVNGSTVLTVH